MDRCLSPFLSAVENRVLALSFLSSATVARNSSSLSFLSLFLSRAANRSSGVLPFFSCAPPVNSGMNIPATNAKAKIFFMRNTPRVNLGIAGKCPVARSMTHGRRDLCAPCGKKAIFVSNTGLLLFPSHQAGLELLQRQEAVLVFVHRRETIHLFRLLVAVQITNELIFAQFVVAVLIHSLEDRIGILPLLLLRADERQTRSKYKQDYQNLLHKPPPT